MEFDVDGDADVLPGYDWLRAHDLAGLYDSDAVCICAGRGCTSGRRIHLDPRLDPPSSSVTRLKPAAARALLGTVCLGMVLTSSVAIPLGPPAVSRCRRRARRR